MIYIDSYRDIPEGLDGSAIWVDIADPTTYTLSGSTFTAMTNKGSKGGSFVLNGSPTLVSDYFWHDATTKWIKWDAALTRPQTVFAVWQCMDSISLAHYLWGGLTAENDNMETSRWGDVGSETSNYFNNTGGNKLFTYSGENKAVFAIKVKPAAINVWENGVQIVDDTLGAQSNVTQDLTAMSILDGRIGYNTAVGDVKLWEFAWYESNLSDASIVNKSLLLKEKHGIL